MSRKGKKRYKIRKRSILKKTQKPYQYIIFTEEAKKGKREGGRKREGKKEKKELLQRENAQKQIVTGIPTDGEKH